MPVSWFREGGQQAGAKPVVALTDTAAGSHQVCPDWGQRHHPHQGRQAGTRTCPNPITASRLCARFSQATGTWQGIWYLEFRASKHQRRVVATIQGEKM